MAMLCICLGSIKLFACHCQVKKVVIAGSTDGMHMNSIMKEDSRGNIMDNRVKEAGVRGHTKNRVGLVPIE